MTVLCCHAQDLHLGRLIEQANRGRSLSRTYVAEEVRLPRVAVAVVVAAAAAAAAAVVVVLLDHVVSRRILVLIFFAYVLDFSDTIPPLL